MFDNDPFNRNSYNRDIASNSMNCYLYCYGNLTVGIVIPFPTEATLSGIGSLNPGLMIPLDASGTYAGSGALNAQGFILGLPLSMTIRGTSSVTPNVSVDTPVSSTFSGQGAMQIQTTIYQNINTWSTGVGNISIDILTSRYMELNNFTGSGSLSGYMTYPLSLTIPINGSSALSLKRLSSYNETVFELDGLNLQPSAEITIDTDELSVFIGYIQDVSCVTTDSVFFELVPGSNNITIETDTGSNLLVTAIWQNRWL